MKRFEGFPEDCCPFLFELGLNNNRTWFDENRERCRASVQEPMKALAASIGPTILEIDPEMVTDVRRVVSRINRDTRFSKDKSPYRNHLWCGWKRAWEDWAVEPAFFFELYPEWHRFGMGFYNIPKTTMDRIRERIVLREPAFMRMFEMASAMPEFRLEGDKYKRTMRGDLPPELLDWYQRKELFLCCNRPNGPELQDGTISGIIAEGFRKLRPFYEWFTSLREEDRRAGE